MKTPQFMLRFVNGKKATKVLVVYALVIAILLLSIRVSYIKFVCVGDSMYPTICDKDTVYLSKTPDLSLNLTGKIIVYSTPEYNIGHRVILDNGVTLTCQGDNNSYADEPISREQIISVVEFITPFYATVGFNLLILGFGFLMLFILFRNNMREKHETKDEM